MDEERTQHKKKLEAAKREAEGLNKEKRDLQARLGQQSRDVRTAASSQQVWCGVSWIWFMVLWLFSMGERPLCCMSM
jgi:hypothetical protein